MCIYLLCFDSSNREPTHSSQFHQQILRVKDRDYFPVIVVANKSDLEAERQVHTSGGFEPFPPAPTLEYD
jgi:GTPase KRas protein